jgi:hypothetical protein
MKVFDCELGKRSTELGKCVIDGIRIGRARLDMGIWFRSSAELASAAKIDH